MIAELCSEKIQVRMAIILDLTDNPFLWIIQIKTIFKLQKLNINDKFLCF